MSAGTDVDTLRRNLLIAGATTAAAAALPLQALAANGTPAQLPQGKKTMATFTTKDGTQLYYKDWGTGPIVTFSHGWPLTADAWEAQ
ncbi:MAG: alpha/beta hydrolase, partial [Pseudoxanthomonas sp.]